MQWRALFAAGSAALCALAAGSAGAITPGLIDDFESGAAGWNVGTPHPAPPLVVASGGPAGSGDAYLLLTATGVEGAGGRLAVISGPAWLGSYTGTGITGIRLDANNLGPSSLDLRLWLQNATLATAISAQPVTLAPGSGWTTLYFPLTAGTLSGNAGVLDGVTALRLFHSSSATYPGPVVAAQLGLDNVTAVPEPSAAALLGGGLLLTVTLLTARRRRALRPAPLGASLHRGDRR